jgi:hypothetical protein
MGFGHAVARSTLGDANESRDRRIFADFSQALILIAIMLYANDAPASQICMLCVRWIRPQSI